MPKDTIDQKEEAGMCLQEGLLESKYRDLTGSADMLTISSFNERRIQDVRG